MVARKRKAVLDQVPWLAEAQLQGGPAGCQGQSGLDSSAKAEMNIV